MMVTLSSRRGRTFKKNSIRPHTRPNSSLDCE